METTRSHQANPPRRLDVVPTPVRERAHGVMDRSAAAGIPSQPLLGRLPLRRLIPMDVHSMMDYQGAFTVAGAGLFACTPAACSTGLLLGAMNAGVSLFTDYRLSLRKLIPIEVHEVADYAWGLCALALPFALGWARKSPVVAALHVVVGASTLLASLFTDYRAQQGVKWRRASVTDLGPVGA